ncbi:hypothetical protein ROHU_009055 [Labeo rohita]|uniref:Uncharacterized protein n=1 Tax=Labeo rohita TaxID=84645 RepID=A0A498M529_LABRO|nr:hypothetical protein ROHU_009055 [Labeo rohita]
MTDALGSVSRRYRLLQTRSLPTPSSQVTRVARNLLSILGSPGEKEREDPEKLVTEPEKEPAAGPEEEGTTAYPFPDHMLAQNQLIEEFRGHWEGMDSTPKLINNVSSKYLNETPPPTCQLTRTALEGDLRREIWNLIRPVRHIMAVHELACQEAAKQRIPEILDLLKSGPEKKAPVIVLWAPHCILGQYLWPPQWGVSKFNNPGGEGRPSDGKRRLYHHQGVLVL